MISNEDIDSLAWEKSGGLLPAIVQDHASLRVLMLGYMTREALEKTIASGDVTFFSRSREALWRKGETSGHVLKLCDIRFDCDKDALLVFVQPQGPTCHTGTQSCFGAAKADLALLADLARTIAARRSDGETKSYTKQLFDAGLARIAQKVGEEGVETALAAVTPGGKLAEEAADLLYHLLVLLEARDLSLADVLAVLAERAAAKPAAGA